MKFFDNLYKYVIALLFLLIITYLSYLSYVQTCYVSMQYTTDVSFFLKDNVAKNILFTLLFLLLIIFFSRLNFVKKIINLVNTNKKIFIIIKTILLFLIAIVASLWVWDTQILPEGDQALILEAVNKFKNNDFSLFNSGEYMENCPNQLGIFLIYYLMSFVFVNNYILSLQLLNVLGVVLIYKNLSEIAGFLKADNFTQLIIIFSAFLFPVLIFYCWLVYGNILGMAFILCTCKYELFYFKDYKVRDIILTSIFLIIAIMAKSFSLVYFIAMLIYAIFKIIETKRYKSLFVIFVLCLALFISNEVPKKIVENKIGHSLNEGMSYYSYIAMGIQESDRAEGWHNKYNINTYHMANNKTEVQKEIAIEDIKSRFVYFFENPSYMLRFYSRKTASQWNNPTFEMFYGLDINNDGEFLYRCGNDYQINKHFVNLLYLGHEARIQEVLNIEQSLILFGSLVYIVSFLLKKDKTKEELLLPLAFVGGFLFLFIWEAKSQYALFYYVILFIYAILGYNNLIKIINEKCLAVNKKQVGVLLIYFVVSVLIFNFSFKDYLIEDNDKYSEYVSYGNTYDWFKGGLND